MVEWRACASARSVEKRCVSAYGSSHHDLVRLYGWSVSGSAPNANTSKRLKRRKDNAGSAGAERQQHFVTNVLLEIREVQRGLALVAEHLNHRRATFFVRFHAGI